MTARLVAGLVLYSIIAIAQERSTLGEPLRRIVTIIDEFQQLVSSSFADVMAQCGAWMSLILANQSTSQLRNRDLSLADFVAENVSIRQRFTCVGKLDVEELQSLSKDKVKTLGGSTVQGLSTSVSFRDMIVPTLERDSILEVSATFGRSFVVLNDGKGHREPVVVQQVHEYENLSHLPMPRSADATTASKQPQQIAGAPVTLARKQRLLSLIAKKQAEESSE